MAFFFLAALPAILGGAGCAERGLLDASSAGRSSGAEQAGELTSEAGGALAPGLSILAWNMESFPLTDSAPAAIEDVLGGMRPDIVGVEEIEDEDVFQSMVDSLNGYQAITADGSDGFTRVGMLYREDRVEVSEIETLFKGDHDAFPRPPLKVHVTVKGSDLDFDFVAVHLKAMMDPASVARRRAGCQKLEAWARARIAAGADPDLVVAGDWNDVITKDPGQNVFNSFLDAPERYRFLTQEVADAGDFSYIPYNSLIDHVLVTTSLLDAYGDGGTHAVHVEKEVTGYVKHVSDHRPIRVLFALP